MEIKFSIGEFLKMCGLDKDIAFDMVGQAIQYGFGSALQCAGKYMSNENIEESELNSLYMEELTECIDEFMNSEISNC